MGTLGSLDTYKFSSYLGTALQARGYEESFWFDTLLLNYYRER